MAVTEQESHPRLGTPLDLLEGSLLRSAKADDRVASIERIFSDSERGHGQYTGQGSSPVTPARPAISQDGAECLRRDIKKARNRESAKKSRLLSKEKWKTLEQTVAAKESLIEKMRIASVKADAELSGTPSTSRVASRTTAENCELSGPGRTAPRLICPAEPRGEVLTEMTCDAALHEFYIEKAENCLYRRLLSPSRAGLSCSAQTFDKLLSVVATDRETLVCCVRFSSVFNPVEHQEGLTIWQSVHPKDQEQVKAILASVLSPVAPMRDEGALILAYRRLSRGRETWVKGAVVAIRGEENQVEGLVIAEFLEH